MKKNIYILILLVLTTINSKSQIQILKDFNFDKGGYSILINHIPINEPIYLDSLGNELGDSINAKYKWFDFYSENTKVLNKIKNDWYFSKESPRYACGYDYIVNICYKGKSVESIAINSDCKEIVSKYGYFYFDSKDFIHFIHNFKYAYYKRDSFVNINDARKYYSDLLANSNIIMSELPQWINYEGKFMFKSRFAYDEGEKKILSKLDSEIKQYYPDEKFVISVSGGSTEYTNIEVICNKTLYDKFKLYPIGYMDWEYFVLKLGSYWKIK
jgi:hypothetical protein